MQTSISWILFLFTIGLSFMQRRNSEAPGSSVQVPDEVRVTQKKAHVSSLFFFGMLIYLLCVVQLHHFLYVALPKLPNEI